MSPLHTLERLSRRSSGASFVAEGNPVRYRPKVWSEPRKALISRDETLAGRSSSSPTQLNVAEMRGFLDV